MPRQKDTTKIHRAAVYFAFVNRDINEIVDAFDTSGLPERHTNRRT